MARAYLSSTGPNLPSSLFSSYYRIIFVTFLQNNDGFHHPCSCHLLVPSIGVLDAHMKYTYRLLSRRDSVLKSCQSLVILQSKWYLILYTPESRCSLNVSTGTLLNSFTVLSCFCIAFCVHDRYHSPSGTRHRILL